MSLHQSTSQGSSFLFLNFYSFFLFRTAYRGSLFHYLFHLKRSSASACQHLISAFTLVLSVSSFTGLSCHALSFSSSTSFPFSCSMPCLSEGLFIYFSLAFHICRSYLTVCRSLYICSQCVFVVIQHVSLSSALSLYFSLVCLSILLSASRAAVIFVPA